MPKIHELRDYIQPTRRYRQDKIDDVSVANSTPRSDISDAAFIHQINIEQLSMRLNVPLTSLHVMRMTWNNRNFSGDQDREVILPVEYDATTGVIRAQYYEPVNIYRSNEANSKDIFIMPDFTFRDHISGNLLDLGSAFILLGIEYDNSKFYPQTTTDQRYKQIANMV